MAKKIDDSGFWLIEDNPVSRAGVFPYLGKQISDALDPDKIYYVLRPADELSNPETIKSFDGIPFIDDHQMLGEGFMPYDKRPGGGVLYDVYFDGGELRGKLKIFSEALKEKIENDKKELSLGYLCDYELTPGDYNGQHYDAIQRNLRGNHIALVDNGRMGSNIRVYDKAITMDALDVILSNSAGHTPAATPEREKAENDPENKEQTSLLAGSKITMDDDKREAIRQVMAIAAKPAEEFKGGDDEKIETIAGILEKAFYPEKAKDELPIEENKEEVIEAKKDDENVIDDEFKADETKTEETEEKKVADACGAKAAEDAAINKMFVMINERNKIAEDASAVIGNFSFDSMTKSEVVKYACDKLGIENDEKVLKGYLKAAGKGKVYGLDSGVITGVKEFDKATMKYLKG